MATELRNMKVAVADNIELSKASLRWLKGEATFSHKFNESEYILSINSRDEEGIPEEVKEALEMAESHGYEYVCFYYE